MRTMATGLGFLLLLLTAAPGARAQEAGHDHEASPYVDLQGREIKALSAEEIASKFIGCDIRITLMPWARARRQMATRLVRYSVSPAEMRSSPAFPLMESMPGPPHS